MKNLRDYENEMRSSRTRGGADDLLGSLGISREVFDRYTAFDEDGLIGELIKNVREMKARGAYDPVSVTAFFEAISPSLDPRQREKMKNVIELINSGEI